MSEAEKILETVASALSGAYNRLWTVEDIAVHFSCSKSTVFRVTAKPGFPEPVEIAGVDGRRWIAEEVREWAKRQRASRKRGPGRPRQT